MQPDPSHCLVQGGFILALLPVTVLISLTKILAVFISQWGLRIQIFVETLMMLPRGMGRDGIELGGHWLERCIGYKVTQGPEFWLSCSFG